MDLKILGQWMHPINGRILILISSTPSILVLINRLPRKKRSAHISFGLAAILIDIDALIPKMTIKIFGDKYLWPRMAFEV